MADHRTERDFANTEEQRRSDAKLLNDVIQMSGAAPQEVTALQPVLANMLKSNDAKLAELRDALDVLRQKQTDASRALLKSTEADYYATIRPLVAQLFNSLRAEAASAPSEDPMVGVASLLSDMKSANVEAVRERFAPHVRGKITADNIKKGYAALLLSTKGGVNLALRPGPGRHAHVVHLNGNDLTTIAWRDGRWIALDPWFAR